MNANENTFRLEAWSHRNQSKNNEGVHIRPRTISDKQRLSQEIAVLSKMQRVDLVCNPSPKTKSDRRLRHFRSLTIVLTGSNGLQVETSIDGLSIIGGTKELGFFAEKVRTVSVHEEQMIPAEVDGNESFIWIWWPIEP